MQLEKFFAKCWPFCLGLTVLNVIHIVQHLFITILTNADFPLTHSILVKMSVDQFPDSIFKSILLFENAYILIQISLKVVPEGPIDDNLVIIGSGNRLVPNKWHEFKKLHF